MCGVWSVFGGCLTTVSSVIDVSGVSWTVVRSGLGLVSSVWTDVDSAAIEYGAVVSCYSDADVCVWVSAVTVVFGYCEVSEWVRCERCACVRVFGMF